MRTLALALVIVIFCSGSAYSQGLPPQFGPLNIKPTAKEIELGRMLFYDPRLSANGQISCSTCHNPQNGWGDGRELAVGIADGLGVPQVGRRHTPHIINGSYSPLMFWDGRVVDEIAQALLPMSNPIEMGQQTAQEISVRLNFIAGYNRAFVDAFNGVDVTTQRAVTPERMARVLAAFQSTVVSYDSPADRRFAGDKNALTPAEEVGFQIFVGNVPGRTGNRAQCLECHAPPFYTSRLVANNGMEFAGKWVMNDRGRQEFSRLAVDLRKFKIPTLRELPRTAPYNHAGNFADIHRVVVHYSTGGKRYDGKIDPNIDRRIQPLDLTDSQMKYLELFLERPMMGRYYPNIEEPRLP